MGRYGEERSVWKMIEEGEEILICMESWARVRRSRGLCWVMRAPILVRERH